MTISQALHMNPEKLEATLEINGEHALLRLTPVEFKVLYYLYEHRDQILTREDLLIAVWGNAVKVFDRTVDMHVSNLRKKLASSMFRIQAVHGSGYRLVKMG